MRPPNAMNNIRGDGAGRWTSTSGVMGRRLTTAARGTTGLLGSGPERP